MFNFLVVWDSGVSNLEAKMIGEAVKECAGIFPNSNFQVYGSRRFTESENVDSIVARAKERNGQKNAYDIINSIEALNLQTLKKARFYTVVFTTRDLYPEGMPANFCFGIQARRTIVQSIARYRNLPNDVLQECIMHILCHELGHLFDAARGRDNGLEKIHPIYANHCEHEGCVMQQMTDVACLRKMAHTEKRGKERFCLQCRMDMAFTLGSRLKLPSYYRIY